MTGRVDCIVIGAGIIGLAVARRLARDGLEVIVVEAERVIGSHTSSRNSEVIHAGIGYPPDSLKARLCFAGKELLYAYCEDHGVPYRRIGKLIVATSAADEAQLQQITARASANGVDDLRWLAADEVASREPAVTATSALLSPSTGIIDSHAYMLSLQGDIESRGGSVVCGSRVIRAVVEDDGILVTTGDGGEFIVKCRYLVNAAGLWAPEVAASIEGFDKSIIPQQHLAKAHYFSYQGRSPFSQLIYPIPSDGGLGIHATNDLGGAARFGPDVSWVDSIDYDFDASRKSDFVAAIRRYFPALDENRLQPAYTGIRPKLSGPGEAAADFVIQGPGEHGITGLVNLFGIESPGLTASLAIGEQVCASLTVGRIE